jgi:hypothetical protein
MSAGVSNEEAKAKKTLVEVNRQHRKLDKQISKIAEGTF